MWGRGAACSAFRVASLLVSLQAHRCYLLVGFRRSACSVSAHSSLQQPESSLTAQPWAGAEQQSERGCWKRDDGHAGATELLIRLAQLQTATTNRPTARRRRAAPHLAPAASNTLGTQPPQPTQRGHVRLRPEGRGARAHLRGGDEVPEPQRRDVVDDQARFCSQYARKTRRPVVHASSSCIVSRRAGRGCFFCPKRETRRSRAASTSIRPWKI